MFQRLIESVCRLGHRHPFLGTGAAVCVSLLALVEVRHVSLDTDLTRLLPESSQAVRWSRELSGVAGDGGYFSVLYEGDDREALIEAVETTARRLAALPLVRSVDYRRPADFIERYRYLLVPSDRLLEALDVVDQWQAEVSPFVIDVGAGDDEGAEPRPSLEAVESDLARYSRLTGYQESIDGRVMGLIVRPEVGVTSLGALRDLFGQLDAVVTDVSADPRVWGGIAGSLRNRIDDYDLIVADLGRSGLVSGLAIVLTLIISFRSVAILPVLLFPLVVGLLWSFALVPAVVGDLNTITSFLLLVLFGMGIDYSIHLTRQFQAELVEHPDGAALRRTFLSSGRSVLTGGITTACGFGVLAVSDFRGFSEFGYIGWSSTLMVVLVMLVVMPATLVAGHRLGLVRPRPHPPPSRAARLLSVSGAGVVAVAVAVSAVLAAGWLRFDYDFTSLSAERQDSRAAELRRQVYSGFSAPAAVYVAPDLDTLDDTLAVLDAAREAERNAPSPPTLGRVTSIRDLVPDARGSEDRRDLIAELQESLAGRWTERVEDPDRQQWIADIREFLPPDAPVDLSEVPADLSLGLRAQDGSGRFLVSVNTAGRSRDGRMAMDFTEMLYGLEMPEGVAGPTGDKPVLAEILWLVLREGPWLVGLALLAVVLVVWIDRRSVGQSLWVVLPLVAGLVLTLGGLVVFGWKLNFLNIVVLPALVGVGVDDGVHYYRRWRETDGDTARTHRELLEPLTVTTLTTVMGYLGLMLAHHPGLRSIGSLGVLGLVCTWVTALVLLPGLLAWRHPPRARAVQDA